MSLFDPKKLALIIMGVKAISILKVISLLIAFVSIIVAITPGKADDTIMEKVRLAWINSIGKIATKIGDDMQVDPTNVCEEIEEEIGCTPTAAAKKAH